MSEEDWDARNLLYSLTFNIGNTIYIPGSTQKLVYVTYLSWLMVNQASYAHKVVLASTKI